jgi:hypothetical protein
MVRTKKIEAIFECGDGMFLWKSEMECMCQEEFLATQQQQQQQQQQHYC